MIKCCFLSELRQDDALALNHYGAVPHDDNGVNRDSLHNAVGPCCCNVGGGLVPGTLDLDFPLMATPLLALWVDVQTAILVTLLLTVAVNIVSLLRGGNWHESIGRYWPLAAFAVLASMACT